MQNKSQQSPYPKKLLDEMERAIQADGKKLRHLTGEDHGPWMIEPEKLIDDLTTVHDIPPQKDIGRLSAEAVLKQYEAAAEAVTKMGEVIKERIKRLEQCQQECDNDMKTIAEMAAAIVDKGTHVAAEIEHTNAVATDIRTVCTDIQQKIVGKKDT